MSEIFHQWLFISKILALLHSLERDWIYYNFSLGRHAWIWPNLRVSSHKKFPSLDKTVGLLGNYLVIEKKSGIGSTSIDTPGSQ